MLSRSVRLLLIAALALVVAAPAFGQQYTGRIEVVVQDATGAVLPGVSVQITGPLDQTTVTDDRGEARFLNLPVGNYQLRATIQGFNEYKNTAIQVVAGGHVQLPIKMAVAGTQEMVNVTAEAPVIDTKKAGTSVAVTLEELQNVPSARDPWVVMQTVPGIVMDRVNVGGSESGQQAGFMGKGADSTQTTWNVDGMPITDMSSLSSPFYYDFDMFQEMNVTTGGADAKSATGGVQLNFMLKTGTNVFHGSARTYYENQSMQSTNLPADLQYLAGATGKGNRTDYYKDWGGEIGGPVLKNRWWFWAAYGRTDVKILTLNNVGDRTLLPNVSAKTSGQITKDLRGSFTYFSANKQKWGRNAGVTRPQETTWDQDGPNDFYKAEANYVIGDNLFLVGRYAHVKGGFTFMPEGGMSKNMYEDDASVYHTTYNSYVTDRPQDAVVADGNYFRGKHEVKFGFSWRKTAVHSTTQWPGSQIVTYWNGYPNLLAQVLAPYVTDAGSKYVSFYAGDTVTFKRLTLNAGLRFDRQMASVLPSTSTTVPGFEDMLPTIVAPAINNVVVQNAIQPRIGVSYALDEAHKSLVRASYALFTDQIGSGEASFMSAAQYRYVEYNAVDLNGNNIADPNEIDRSTIVSFAGFDPSNPNNIAASYNKVGTYTWPKTHEIMVSLDHELMPNFGVSASFTYRHSSDFNWRPYIGVTPANYIQQGTLTGNLPTCCGASGQPYSVNWYNIDPNAVPTGGGTTYETRDGYYRKFVGMEISATKRMSNHWMARVGFSSNSWREYWKSGVTPVSASQDPTPQRTDPLYNGGLVFIQSSGSGKSNIFMALPKYQFMANGMYELPYGIDLAGNLLIRQGYPEPWDLRLSTGDELNNRKFILFDQNVENSLLPKVATFDFRVGKVFKVNRATLNFDLDIFNLFNAATVLQRSYQQQITSGSTAYTNVMEIMQPRVVRIGFRFNF